MQLREEEYSEQLTLVDFYYQWGDMGSTPAKISGVSFPRWCMRFVYALFTVCIRFIKLPRDTVRHGRTALALLHCWAFFRHNPMNASRSANSFLARGRRATILCSANFIDGKGQKVR